MSTVVTGATPLRSSLTPEDAYGAVRAWYALFVLELQVLLVGVDLAIVTLLVHPIEAALRVDDVGFATITATPVALGIAVAYYPAGLIADTFRRRDMIAAGAVIWALAALVAARAESPAMLFVARLLAGLGTGVSGPSVFSMLCDAFPRSRRAFATSAFLAGISIGGGVGLTLCGALVQAAQRNGKLHVSGMQLASWQQCFIAVALCGVATVALVLTLPEPPRRERAVRRESNLGLSLSVFLRYLRRNALLWGAIFLGYSIGGTSYSAIVAWAPTLGTRRFGAAELSSIALLGTFGAAGSLPGAIGGGLLAQRVINLGRSRLLPRLFVIVSAVSCIFAAGFPYMPTWTLAVVGIGLLTATSTALQCLVPIGIQETAPNEVRGQLVGVLGLIGFVPQVIGATLVAFLASHTSPTRAASGRRWPGSAGSRASSQWSCSPSAAPPTIGPCTSCEQSPRRHKRRRESRSMIDSGFVGGMDARGRRVLRGRSRRRGARRAAHVRSVADRASLLR